MGQNHMRARQRQSQLFFHPWPLFAMRIALARQSTIVLVKLQILSCHKAGIDGRTRQSCGQERGLALDVSTHDLVVDRHHATPFGRLYHLGIAQLLVGNAPLMGMLAPRSMPWRLVPFSTHMPQGGAVFRPLIAGKNGRQVYGDMHDPIQQQMGFSLRLPADEKATINRHAGVKATQTQALPWVSR